MVLTIKVMMVVFGSIDLFRGIGATKVVQDLPKINASLYESPTLTKLEFPIQETMHMAHRAPSINSLLSNQTETHRKKIRKIETKIKPEVSKRHFFNFETRMKISPIQYGTSRRISDFR